MGNHHHSYRVWLRKSMLIPNNKKTTVGFMLDRETLYAKNQSISIIVLQQECKRDVRYREDLPSIPASPIPHYRLGVKIRNTVAISRRWRRSDDLRKFSYVTEKGSIQIGLSPRVRLFSPNIALKTIYLILFLKNSSCIRLYKETSSLCPLLWDTRIYETYFFTRVFAGARPLPATLAPLTHVRWLYLSIQRLTHIAGKI